jgi:hypothetical protein
MTPEEAQARLPEQFKDLSAHGEWIAWTDEERVHKQANATVEELAVFYHAMLPRAEEIYDYLEPVDHENMSDEERTLLCLGAAFAEIADGVEYYSPESTAAAAMPRFLTSHDSLLGFTQEVQPLA